MATNGYLTEYSLPLRRREPRSPVSDLLDPVAKRMLTADLFPYLALGFMTFCAFLGAVATTMEWPNPRRPRIVLLLSAMTFAAIGAVSVKSIQTHQIRLDLILSLTAVMWMFMLWPRRAKIT